MGFWFGGGRGDRGSRGDRGTLHGCDREREDRELIAVKLKRLEERARIEGALRRSDERLAITKEILGLPQDEPIPRRMDR